MRQDEQRERIIKELEANFYKELLQFLQHQNELSDWYKRFNEAKQQGRPFDEPPPDLKNSSDLTRLFSATSNDEPSNSQSGTDEHSKNVR